LKNKLSYQFLLLLVALLFSFNIHAQVSTDTSTVDVETPAVEEEATTYYPDTLKREFRSVGYDSVKAVNSDKGFYYKRYMDSLLRATQFKVQKPRRRVDLSGSDFFSSIFGIIFWILAIGLFVYLVYRLFLSNSSFLSRSRKNIASDIAVVEEENTSDPDSLLRNAIRNGNYRLAVRYLYLQSLQRLSEKKFIEINTNKTNYEYVMEVRRHKFANEFASLTIQYEYVWYGEYPVDERLFEQIQGSFTQFNKNNLK
jgi:predicted transcriptional regulator